MLPTAITRCIATRSILLPRAGALPLSLSSRFVSCSFATFHSSIAVATTTTNKRSTVKRFERRRLLNDPPICGVDSETPFATRGHDWLVARLK